MWPLPKSHSMQLAVNILMNKLNYLSHHSCKYIFNDMIYITASCKFMTCSANTETHAQLRNYNLYNYLLQVLEIIKYTVYITVF